MSSSRDQSSGWNALPHHHHVRGHQWSGWLIVAGFLVPMLLAYAMYATGIGVPQRAINHGELLVPATSLAGLSVTDSEGKRLDLSADKKWRWLIVGDNVCTQACQDLLYVSRQVHIRLAEKAYRLERVYLNTDPLFSDGLATHLQQDHPGLVMAHVAADAWQQLINGTNVQHELNGETLYVVDQEGFAMMTYSSQHAGNDILDDIKRLLKYSYEDRGP